MNSMMISRRHTNILKENEVQQKGFIISGLYDTSLQVLASLMRLLSEGMLNNKEKKMKILLLKDDFL